MTSNTQELLIRIKADASSALAELGGVNKGIVRVGDSADAVKNSLARMGHFTAGFFGVRELATAADSWTNLRSKIDLVSPSTAAAASAMGTVYGIAQQTGQALDSIGSIYQRVARNAAQYSLGAAQVAGITRAVANAVILSGASAASADAALMQFGQALASGQLRGEELNSVMEQTPALAEAIARGMGITVGELKKLGEEGRLTAKEVLGAISEESARLEEEAGRMAMTIGRAMTQLQNSFSKWAGGSGDAAGVVAGAVSLVARNFDLVADAIVTAGAAWAAFKIASWVKDATLAIGGMHPVVRGITLAVTGVTLALEAWGRIRNLIPQAAFDAASDRVNRLAAEIAKVNSEVKALSGEQYRVTRVRAVGERDALGTDIDKRNKAIEDYAGDKRSKEYKQMIREVEDLGGQWSKLNDEIKALDENAGLVGTKLSGAFLEKFATKAGKSAKEMHDAAAEFKKAYDALEGTRNQKAEQNKLTAGFSAWLIEEDKKAKEKKPHAKEDPLARMRLEARAAGMGLAPDTVAEMDKLDAALARRNISQAEYLRLLALSLGEDRVVNQAERDKQRLLEQTRSAQDAMAQSVQGVAKAYEQRNQTAAEARLTSEERDLAAALRQVSERAQQAREALANKAASMAENEAAQAAYRQALAAVDAAEAAQMEIERTNHAERLARNADWKAGASQAMDDYLSKIRDVAGQSKELFSKSFQGMEDALVKFVQTGKLDFKSLAESIISDMIRMQVRAQMAPVTEALSGWLGKAIGAILPGGGGSDPLDYGSFTGGSTAAAPWAKGAAFSAPGLSAYSGRVVDRPTFFASSGGPLAFHAQGNVFGEAGPEAIMPLSRDGAGRLGVRAQGGGNVSISMPVTIDARGADASVIPSLTAALQQLEARVYRNVPGLVRQAQIRNRVTPTV